MSLSKFWALAFLVLLVFCPASLFSQTNSSISGTVVDQSQGVLPGVSLTLTEAATGAARTAVSNDTGLFRITGLGPGRYSLRVEAQGFKVYEIREISLATSEIRDLGRLPLQLGAITEEVTVTAAATAVQFASAERSALVDSAQLGDIAMKGRDVFDYMRFIPGVIDMNTNRDASASMSMSGVTINGMQHGSKNITIDGTNAVDQQQGNSTFVTPNVDAIGEIRVVANGFAAEYGRNAGGTINVITKSGTKDLHGTLYWNRRHEGLNANSFFNNRQGIPRAIYRYFVGGYAIGGPIAIPGLFNSNREKFFFFWSQEYTRNKVPTATTMVNQPTLAERNGDFSNSKDSLGRVIPIIDPTTGKQFPGNIIPTSRINATGQAFLKIFPLPNGWVNPSPGQQYSSNYLGSMQPTHNHRNDILRFDAQLAANLAVYFRYGHDTDETSANFTLMPGVGSTNNFLPGWLYTGHLTHTINPTTVNEVTFGWGRNMWGYEYKDKSDQAIAYRSSTLNPPTLFPLPTGSSRYAPYLPRLTFAGGNLAGPTSFGPGSTTGSGTLLGQNSYWTNFNKIWSGQDDFSKITGNHSLKSGVYIEKNLKNHDAGGQGYGGYYNFGHNTDDPLSTGHGYANALTGHFQSYAQATNTAYNLGTSWTVEGYIQDNWRATRKLTLDIGLRFSHMGPLSENQEVAGYGRFFPEKFDSSKAVRLYWPTLVNGKRLALDKATGVTAPYALVGTVIPGTGTFTTGFEGVKGSLYELPFLAVAPRFGFALDVAGDGKTAIRGSFAVFYNRPSANDGGMKGGVPTILNPTVYYSSIDEVPQLAKNAAYPASSGGAAIGQLKLEDTWQGNLTIQRDIGFGTVVDIGWVGTFDRHARQAKQINNIPIYSYGKPENLFQGRAINADLLRTGYQGMGAIQNMTYDLSAVNYHGLQTSARHRMTRGLQFSFSYTFSKALGTNGWDPYTNQRERYYGPLINDRRHSLAISYSYALPGASNAVLNAISRGWTLSGATMFQTGAGVTPTCVSTSSGIDNSDPSWTGLGATGVAPALRCRQVADPNAFTHDFYNNFNTKAFALASPGTFGDIGIRTLRQPSWTNWDMTLARRIPLGKSETRALRIRVEAYNVFNHTAFSTIGTTYSFSGTTNTNTTTGQYTEALSPRVMSTTLRFEF